MSTSLSSTDISRNMQAALKVLDPDISAEPLTVERKIIDTVSEVLAGGNIDQYVLNYQYDIDSISGSDLDNFVAIFGFARQGGTNATGSITFSTATAAIVDISIPAGTQIITPPTSVTQTISFITTASVTLYTGTTQAIAPIECIVSGAVGNVAANTIISFSTLSSSGISGVTNDNATSNGTDPETDPELRVRFKNTILRNVAGTKDQYLAVAISSQFTNKASVIGPISRYTEYIQTDTSGNATSLIPYSKYTYPYDYYLTDGSSVNETFYNPRGVDYTFNTTVPPSISVNNTTTIPDGSVILLEHSYCSINSRNDPANSIANFIDIYVSGEDAINATETCLFPTTTFSSSSGSPYYNLNFERDNDRTTPLVGNTIQTLIWQPILLLPGSITIGNTTYNLNNDYWLVKDNTNYRGSRRSRDGIEWSSGAAASIGASTQFSLTYTFNRLPLTLNEIIDQHKQVTTDTLVHNANLRYFNINLVIMYTPGYSRSAVDVTIGNALEAFLEQQDFGSIIQVSDLIDIVHNVIGVDNVRLARPADGTSWGIQEVAPDGITPLGGILLDDFTLQDSDLPILENIFTIQRSQNSWN